MKFAVSKTPAPQPERGKKAKASSKGENREEGGGSSGAAIVIWTTTPWTIPGNRAIAFSKKIEYGLYEVTEAPADNWTKSGERFILAKKLADSFFQAARAGQWKLLNEVDPTGLMAAHPLHGNGYDFKVPLLEGDHVTEDAGTGFVHTAPGHGADDFEIWTANARHLMSLGIDPAVPETVGQQGSSLLPFTP